MVEILLKHFTHRDIQRADRFGKTALHYAAALGYRATLVALVSANPSLVYVADNDGNLPLHIIVKNGHQCPMVKDILSSNPSAAEILDRKGRNALHVAVMNGNLPMLKVLVELPELKVLINEPDSDGNTPLHLAAKIHYDRIVTILLANGANGRITNRQGLTPRDINDFDEESPLEQVLFCALAQIYQHCQWVIGYSVIHKEGTYFCLFQQGWQWVGLRRGFDLAQPSLTGDGFDRSLVEFRQD